MEKKYPTTMTVAEVCAEFSFATRTLHRYIKDGKIKATKPGNKILIYSDSVLRFLKKHESFAS